MFLLLLRRPYSAAAAFLHFRLLVLLSLLSAATTQVRTSATLTSNFLEAPSFLPLNVGLNLSIAFNVSPSDLSLSNVGSGAPSLFRIGVLSSNFLFLPILSSPGFYNLSSAGFSLGFLLMSSSFYLAVCGGLAGTLSAAVEINDSISVTVSVTSGKVKHLVNFTEDGYAMPLWTANGDTRLPSYEGISLEVVPGAAPGDRNALQLRDHATRTVVWSVRDAGLMEMKDTGNLVIYNTVKKTNIVWQNSSQPRDILFQGQKLTAGMELRSNDSAYIARMEKGGLVLYLNKVRFNEQPAAYSVISLSFPSNYSSPNMGRGVLRKQLLELPCEPSYMALLDYGRLILDLEPGRCTVGNTWTTYLLFTGSSTFHNFLRLEIDGRLYFYSVSRKGTVLPVSVDRFSLDLLGANTFFRWGECATPMACGPLGVCTPFVPSLCSCPSSSAEAGSTPHFQFINSSDDSKGCQLATPLPHCILGNEHIGTTSYLQVNKTATIFLFGGWPFDFFTSPGVEKCKEHCSANCSCTGFFYQATNFACFFMTDAIGLLRIHDQQNINSLFYFIPSNGQVLAKNYTTYLKIKSALAPPSKNETTRILVASSSAVVAFVLILGLVLYLFQAMKRKREREKARQAENEELRDILPLLPSRFSYDDLHKATKGFSELVGAGGCGSVYAGVLLDGRKVAVKLLEAGLLKGQQSKQFLAEVATVGRTNHHNVVRLVGFCWEVYHRLLVYEYMEKGSLDQWLFVKGVDVSKSTVPAVLSRLLDWPTRYNVALGIARGLTYLHEECLQPILHFDIKPQNILLDDAFVAKLADFGLSKLMQRGISEVVTGLRGTPGYIAPEMQAHGAVSKKSDVYSMGMVMLEIVSGRKNIDITLLNSACNEWHFPSWAAKKCEQGLMLELVDKRIGQAYDKEQACRLIQTAFWCIHDVASKRPSASTVVQWLEGKCFISQPPFSVIAHTQSSVEEDIPSF